MLRRGSENTVEIAPYRVCMLLSLLDVIRIDQMDEVEFWVRNLDRQPNFSFWLQTSTDKFYADFVCKLKDGRFLVVEYKGADRWSNDDSKEKRRLGELWALKSNGTCRFVMPKGKDWPAIMSVVQR